MDITDFYDTFFEEAEELLADMERHLLELDVDAPDVEQLNAIFRAAHSIKGGAGTFGFDVLQKTTHLFENLLDHARNGELALRRDIVDTFLETKDMLNDQLAAYRSGDEPDQEAFARICQTLQQLALEEIGKGLEAAGGDTPAPAAKPAAEPVAPAEPAAAESSAAASDRRRVALLNVGEKDRDLLVEELGQLGEVIEHHGDEARYEVVMESTVGDDDIEAVMCFIIDADQLEIGPAEQAAQGATSAKAAQGESEAVQEAEPAAAAETAASAAEDKPAAPKKAADKPQAAAKPQAADKAKAKAKGGSESTSIRVSVDKVDQIINLVGELIITQSMLDQTVSELEGPANGNLVNGMSLRRREGRFSNSALVVTVRPDDFPVTGPLGGIALQEEIETAAFRAGGGDYFAPAQNLLTFLKGGRAALPSTTCRPGVREAELDRIFPPFVCAGVRRALPHFDRRMRGFVTAEAALIAAETRTSAPLRIVRGDDGQSPSHPGLHPCGEGAGYAGGIMSAALDGLRSAEGILSTFHRQEKSL